MIIVGLGNPGEEYVYTAHNIGFAVVEKLASAAGVAFSTEGNYLVARCEHVLLKPQTYMNASGKAVELAVIKYKEPVLVISDDLDLPLGKIRIRRGGGAGGHHGLESILEKIGDFPRVKVGVGRGDADGLGQTIDYLLSPVEDDCRASYDACVDFAADAVSCILRDGIDKAMNAFNARTLVTVAELNRAPQEAQQEG